MLRRPSILQISTLVRIMSADLISRPKLKSFVHATVDKHSLPGGDRGQRDDAAPLLTLHVWDHFAGEVHRTEKVRIESPLPVFEACGQKSLGWRPAGVRHTDIHAAKVFHHVGHKTSHGSGIGNIEGFRKYIGVELLPYLFGRRVQRLLIARTHGHAATLGSESFCGRAANALARSRH